MTYTYECRACGRQWEEEQRIVDPPLERCPECDGEVHRIITQRTDHAVGFVLNGNRWAKDGYSG